MEASMFVNRTAELAWLEARWRAKDAQLLIVYGKRRVGKTALLKAFLQGKAGIYFLADRRPEREQLREVAVRLGGHFSDTFIGRKGFDTWLEAFEYLATRLRPAGTKAAKRLVLILDEYPYLVENNSATSSLFQKGWDETLQHLPLTLVLCGSSMAMMESETLAHAPRSTAAEPVISSSGPSISPGCVNSCRNGARSRTRSKRMRCWVGCRATCASSTSTGICSATFENGFSRRARFCSVRWTSC
jgi:hypothetical protein